MTVAAVTTTDAVGPRPAMTATTATDLALPAPIAAATAVTAAAAAPTVAATAVTAAAAPTVAATVETVVGSAVAGPTGATTDVIVIVIVIAAATTTGVETGLIARHRADRGSPGVSLAGRFIGTGRRPHGTRRLRAVGRGRPRRRPLGTTKVESTGERCRV